MRSPQDILRDTDRMIAHLQAELNAKQQVVNKLVATMVALVESALKEVR